MENKSIRILSVMSGFITLLLVSCIFIQFRTVDESKELDIEGMRDDELKTQIATYKSKYEETMEKYQENKNKIDEYTTAVNENKETTEILDNELKQARELLGLTEVSGTGVIVTLTDTDEALSAYTADDLLDLVNELKYAGAEAISINDNRIVNLSDIVVINDGLIVMYGDIRISSPYQVKAIGDSKYLMSTLSMKNSGYIDRIEASGMKIEVEQKNNIDIKAYHKDIESKYLKGGE